MVEVRLGAIQWVHEPKEWPVGALGVGGQVAFFADDGDAVRRQYVLDGGVAFEVHRRHRTAVPFGADDEAIVLVGQVVKEHCRAGRSRFKRGIQKQVQSLILHGDKIQI